MFTIKTMEETFNELISRLETNKKFYYTRFGDGDCTLARGIQKTPVGNNQMVPSEAFAAEMRRVLNIDHPDFLKAISIAGIDTDELWFDEGGATNIDKGFVDSFPPREYFCERTFCYYLLHRTDEFESFIKNHIRGRKIMYIGGNSREGIERVYGPLAKYIQIPEKGCNTVLQQIWESMEDELEGIELVLPSAGAVTKILNKRMFEKGVDIMSLDFGSIHDAYDGKHTRSWIRNEKQKLEEFVKRF